MRCVVIGILLGLGAACVCLAAPRQWTDNTGKFQIEASLVTIKDGKVYLDKTDGTRIAVDVAKLSEGDLEYLSSLPEYRGQVKTRRRTESSLPKDRGQVKEAPPAETEPAAAPPKFAVIRTPDETKVGEVPAVCRSGAGLSAVAFSPDVRLLAVGKGLGDGTIHLFDVDKGTRVATVRNTDHNRGDVFGLGVQCLVFTPDGKKLLSGLRGGLIRIWNVGPQGDLTEAGDFAEDRSDVVTISVGSDSRTVISGGGDEKLRCWDAETKRERFALGGFQHSVRGFSACPGF